MRDEKEERKKQARSNKQTNKAKQHSTPKAVTFPRKNELPQVACVCILCKCYMLYIVIVYMPRLWATCLACETALRTYTYIYM